MLRPPRAFIPLPIHSVCCLRLHVHGEPAHRAPGGRLLGELHGLLHPGGRWAEAGGAPGPPPAHLSAHFLLPTGGPLPAHPTRRVQLLLGWHRPPAALPGHGRRHSQEVPGEGPILAPGEPRPGCLSRGVPGWGAGHGILGFLSYCLPDPFLLTDSFPCLCPGESHLELGWGAGWPMDAAGKDAGRGAACLPLTLRPPTQEEVSALWALLAGLLPHERPGVHRREPSW